MTVKGAFPGRGLYVITDSERLDFPELYRRTEAILAAGVPVLQYRDKTAGPVPRRERALALRRLCDRHGTLFLINDDVQLARDIGGAGVHIGADDMSYDEARRLLGKSAIIGVSCYNRLDLAQDAQEQGASYVAFGAFFSTRTKLRTVPADTELLVRARTLARIPIVAIGGITPENGSTLLRAGADLLAVASGIYGSDDPGRVVCKFNVLFDNRTTA
jgi:thiamine-phosphate pyrophosphorylase